MRLAGGEPGRPPSQAQSTVLASWRRSYRPSLLLLPARYKSLHSHFCFLGSYHGLVSPWRSQSLHSSIPASQGARLESFYSLESFRTLTATRVVWINKARASGLP